MVEEAAHPLGVKHVNLGQALCPISWVLGWGVARYILLEQSSATTILQEALEYYCKVRNVTYALLQCFADESPTTSPIELRNRTYKGELYAWIDLTLCFGRPLPYPASEEHLCLATESNYPFQFGA